MACARVSKVGWINGSTGTACAGCAYKLEYRARLSLLDGVLPRALVVCLGFSALSAKNLSMDGFGRGPAGVGIPVGSPPEWFFQWIPPLDLQAREAKGVLCPLLQHGGALLHQLLVSPL